MKQFQAWVAVATLSGSVAWAETSPTVQSPVPAKPTQPVVLAQASTSAGSANSVAQSGEDAKKNLEVKKEKKKGPSFSPGFSIWQGWGYQKDNPYFGTSIYFSPSFTISENQRVSAFVGLSSEYTQPDDGRRLYWSNTFVTYTYDLWKPKVGSHKFVVSAGGQVILPTDEGARNRATMRFAFGPLLRASWTYKMLTLSARASLLKYVNGSTTEELQSTGATTVNGVAVQEPVQNTTGRANPNFQVLSVLGAQLKFTKKLYFDSQIWLINQFPYRFDSANRSPGAEEAIRYSYWAFGEVGYEFTKVFSLGIGFSLSASQLSPGGRNFYLPFNNYNNNFSTYLSLTFSPSVDL